MSKTFSGKQLIKILEREFSFYLVSQKGSHVKMAKKTGSRHVTTIVPLHRELSRGTLHGVLELAQIDEHDFWDKVL